MGDVIFKKSTENESFENKIDSYDEKRFEESTAKLLKQFLMMSLQNTKC